MPKHDVEQFANKRLSLLQTTGLFCGMHKGMTIAAAIVIIAFVLFTSIDTDFAGSVFGAARLWIETTFSWYYLATVVFLISVCFFLLVSPYGNIRLGDDNSKPEFSRFAWFSMLLSAGIGIGILFFGVAEPLFYLDNSHSFGYPNNPYADSVGATTMGYDRAVAALRVTYFHWGFHGWAIYVLVGLSLAYFAFRKKLPLALRSALYPLIGLRIYGPMGHAVDIVAIFGAVFGIATSLGLGVSQMAIGLERLIGIDPGTTTQIVLIIIITAVATFSAVSGVGKGIKIISQSNILLSAVLLAFFLFGGPTGWLLSLFADSMGDYLAAFIPMGLWFPSEEGAAKWQGSWTIFYWGWWLAWAPFVGIFIARISKGRTIREFTLGVMLVPTFVIFFWLGIFGGSAMYQELSSDAGVGNAGLIQLVRDWNLPAALFGTIEGLTETNWLSWLISALATFLLASWFVTSSDSGTLVISTVLSLGDNHPPRLFRIFWGIMVGFVAVSLLLAGGLEALQGASIAAALPLSVVIIIMTIGMVKSLYLESKLARSEKNTTDALLKDMP